MAVVEENCVKTFLYWAALTNFLTARPKENYRRIAKTHQSNYSEKKEKQFSFGRAVRKLVNAAHKKTF